jgi:hypothetical protein
MLARTVRQEAAVDDVDPMEKQNPESRIQNPE